MYAPIDPAVILQGDIIHHYNFINLPGGEEPLIVRKITDLNPIIKPLSQSTGIYASGRENLIANSFQLDAIIISQSCDIQRREYIHLCPIYEVQSILTQAETENWSPDKLRNYLKDLRNGNTGYFFYLPAGSIGGINIPESYVDLQYINVMHKNNIGSYTRIISLSDLGRNSLTLRLMNFYGRPVRRDE